MLKPTGALRAAEWSKTLHLPKSSFPPRPIVSDRAKYLKQCTDDLYSWQAVHRPASNPFVLHDGPPYANGSLHIGHGLNKVLKDIVCRFQLSQGKRVHYVPGWDCHGLPIEVKALQALGSGSDGDHRKMSAMQIRKAASKLAEKTIKEQRKGFREWGVFGDWDNAYKTMDKDFEVRQLRIFKKMVEKGLIYRQHKPVYWSPSSGTALAEAELEYDDQHESLAAYVGFRILTAPEVLKDVMATSGGALYALIWTTTPWTLPSNSAIAVHDSLEYVVIRQQASLACFIVAADRVEDVVKVAELGDIEVVAEGLRGSQLAGATGYVPSLTNKGKSEQPVIHADFVSGGSGTGLVHCAAGHGLDEYDICMSHGLEAIAPIDDAGRFTRAVHDSLPEALEGVEVLNGGSQAVIQHLMAISTSQTPLDWQIVGLHKYIHKYPIDWRTKQPIIMRATAQWFADVGSVKDVALRALRNVRFIPESGRSRLESFVSGRSQWCISRQRSWGVPIPAIYRVLNGGESEAVMTPQSIEHIIGVIEARGINAWWTDEADEAAWVHPDLPAGRYIRGKDTMDVWFDSGTTWTGLPAAFSGLPPSDVVLEGTDQHRGWFQSSLLTYIACQDSSPSADAPAPYKTLLTHGFTLDQEGRKMSKSLGNVISPSQIMDGSLLPPLKLKKKQQQPSQVQDQGALAFDAMGPDALRLWAASSDYTRDVVVGEAVLKAVTGNLHKLRVTFKWLLGVLSDVSPNNPLPSLKALGSTLGGDLPEMLALRRLQSTASQVHSAYTNFEPFKATQVMAHYINQDLSAQWFEAAKDPLYAGTDSERRAAQRVCYEILQQMLVMLAPIVPILVQETLAYFPPGLAETLAQNGHDPFTRVWNPSSDDPYAQMAIAESNMSVTEQTTALKSIHAEVRLLQEAARVDKRIGSGLECRVALLVFSASDRGKTPESVLFEMLSQAQAHGAGLEKVFVVSDVEIGRRDSPETGVELGKVTTEELSDGSWRYSSNVDVQGACVQVAVAKAQHGKCPRCWQYKVVAAADEDATSAATPAGDESRDKLCGRCEHVIEQLKASR